MRESRWQQFDFVIVACVLGLIMAGVAMIHSATCGSPCAGLLPPSSYALRQGESAAVGFALLVAFSLIDYRLYRVYAYHLFGFAVALLILVLASSNVRGFIIPINLAVAAVMAIVVTSYRQVVRAYPTSAGSYVVSSENLATIFGLIAGAGAAWAFASSADCTGGAVWRASRRAMP